MNLKELKQKAYDEGLHDANVTQLIQGCAEMFVDTEMTFMTSKGLTLKQKHILMRAYKSGVRDSIQYDEI